MPGGARNRSTFRRGCVMESMHVGGPEIGGWYRDHEGRVFEVVAQDLSEGAIEIQHFDGTVEELDVQDWFSLLAQPVEPPDDWSGAMDVSADDTLVEYDAESDTGWEDPLNRLDRL